MPDECDVVVLRRFAGPVRATNSLGKPSDSTLTVGPDHLVVTINSEIIIYDRSGTELARRLMDVNGDPGFFEEIGATGTTFDPRCAYDQYTDRYVLMISESTLNGAEAWINIAVSRTSDPTDLSTNGWHKYRMPAPKIQGQQAWVNFPGLGLDESGVYVTGNLLMNQSTYTNSALIRAVDKRALLAGLPALQRGLHYTDFVVEGGYTILPCRSFGDAPAAYFVQSDCPTYADCASDRLGLYAFSGSVTEPNLSQAYATVPEPYVAPSYGSDLAYAPDGSTDAVVTASDGSLFNAVWRDGRLYTAHAALYGEGIGLRRTARWYAVETLGWTGGAAPPFPVESGNLEGGSTPSGAPVFTYMPAVAVNACGHVGVVLVHSSVEEHPGVYATAARRDASGQLRMPYSQPIRRGDRQAAQSKWGDYLGIAPDPHDGSFWAIGQVAAPPPFRYRMWIGRLSVGGGEDANSNGILDECEDCNANGINDVIEVQEGSAADCNQDGVPDACEVAELRRDCNRNGAPDACDLQAGVSSDCDGNGIPDECDLDCNGNGSPDMCELAAGQVNDCNGNSVPDECEPISGGDFDGDGDVDTDDIVVLVDCLEGPDVPPLPTPATCGVLCLAAFDFDHDGDVDLRDFFRFQAVFTQSPAGILRLGPSAGSRDDLP